MYPDYVTMYLAYVIVAVFWRKNPRHAFGKTFTKGRKSRPESARRPVQGQKGAARFTERERESGKSRERKKSASSQVSRKRTSSSFKPVVREMF